MSDPKPRKPARKSTRSRSGAKPGTEEANAAGTPDEGATTASAPPSNELRNMEEPMLAIQQVSDGDTSTINDSDNSYSSDDADTSYGADGLDGDIRRRAYELYLARGGVEGNDLADWLEAERLVRSRRSGSEQRAQSTQDSPPAE